MTNKELLAKFKSDYSFYFESGVDYSYLIPFADDLAVYLITDYARHKRDGKKKDAFMLKLAKYSLEERKFIKDYILFVNNEFKDNKFVHGKKVS